MVVFNLNKVVVIAIITLLIGFGIGVSFTINRVVHIASGFIAIDYDRVYQALFQYDNNIGGCYPSQLNGTNIYNDEGNNP